MRAMLVLLLVLVAGRAAAICVDDGALWQFHTSRASPVRPPPKTPP